MNTFRWRVILPVAILAGCTRQPPPPAPAAKPAIGFDAIHLERSACLGRCPVYQVDIGRDGVGRLTDEAYVKAKGTREVHLSEADMALLASVVERSGFWSWKNIFRSKEDGCDELVTDFPWLTISVTRAQTTKTVVLDLGCTGAAVPSDRMNWLADTIDILADTRTLTYDPDALKKFLDDH